MSHRILLLLLLFSLAMPAAASQPPAKGQPPVLQASPVQDSLPAIQAPAPPTPLLMPIGGGYSDIYAGFSAAAVARPVGSEVAILVLPIAYATNPFEITDAERQDNLAAAEERRYQIEEACKRAAPDGLTCRAVLAPVLTRSDAENPDLLSFFAAPLSAVFILGGDQTVAMQAVQDTPFEAALQAAYESGTLVAGTSAGAGVLAQTMLGGYSRNYADNTSLQFGAVDVWFPPARRGLTVGVTNAIFDQHFYQRSRPGRLLNAITLPEAPHVGVGIDAYTGIHLTDGRVLEDVFGLYTVTVFDAETYHAADGARYLDATNTLSVRNVLVHLLSPGPFSYDLETRQASLAAPPEQVDRDFRSLALPSGAGPLILAGSLGDIPGERSALGDHLALAHFANLAGGSGGKVLVVASGYPSDSAAQRAADKYAAALGVPAETLVLPAEGSELLELPTGLTGLVLIGRDQAKIQPARLGSLREAWLAGLPLLADEAGAAVAGRFYSAHSPTPGEAEDAEAATQKSFLQGRTEIAPGLDLLPVQVEPRLIADNRWGRLFSLAYAHPELPALGLNTGSAVVFDAEGARVIGPSPLLTLDLRHATLGLGDNGGLVIANGLLDVFVGGEALESSVADRQASFTRQATPVLLSPTPLPSPTLPPTPTAEPTPTLQPPPATQPPTEIPASTATLPPPAALTPTPRPDSGLLAAAGLPLGAVVVGLLGLVGALLISSRRKNRHER